MILSNLGRITWPMDRRPQDTSPQADDTTLTNDPIYPTPPLGQDMTQGQFLSGV